MLEGQLASLVLQKKVGGKCKMQNAKQHKNTQKTIFVSLWFGLYVL